MVSELRKAKSSYFMQLFADSQGNSSLIWKHMNKLTNQKFSQSKDILKLNINGKVSTDALEIANEFNTFFVKSVQELAANFNSVCLSHDIVRNSSTSFYISQVDQDKIDKIINQLNSSKAKDIFGLDASFIKKT